MIIKTEEDLKGLQEIGKIVGTIRDEMIQAAKPGITTKELDEFAGKLLRNLERFQDLKVNMIFQALLV